MPNETPRQDDHQCENIVQPVATRSTARAAAVSQLVRTSADRPQHGGVDVLGDPLHRWKWIEASSQAMTAAHGNSQARPVAPM
jgi:hypothetical protein